MVVTLPTHADLRHGIANWLPLGNLGYGDCTIAAYEHINMIHNLATTSWWKRLAYRIGYQPPSNAYAISEYAAYLATVGEKPSPVNGVNPDDFLAWEQKQGRVNSYQFYPTTTANASDTIREVMLQWNGCMVGLLLTERAYEAQGAWVLEPGDTPSINLAHAVAMVAYSNDMNGIVTWGKMKEMTVEFANATVYGCWGWS